MNARKELQALTCRLKFVEAQLAEIHESLQEVESWRITKEFNDTRDRLKPEAVDEMVLRLFTVHSKAEAVAHTCQMVDSTLRTYALLPD